MATANLNRRTEHVIVHSVLMASTVYWVTTYPDSKLMDIRNRNGRKVNFGEPARDIVRKAIKICDEKIAAKKAAYDLYNDNTYLG